MHWEFVGHSVCDFVRSSLNGMPLDPILYKTLLVLIPKVHGPERISQFGLISLCSVIYKILTKDYRESVTGFYDQACKS